MFVCHCVSNFSKSVCGKGVSLFVCVGVCHCVRVCVCDCVCVQLVIKVCANMQKQYKSEREIGEIQQIF